MSGNSELLDLVDLPCGGGFINRRLSLLKDVLSIDFNFFNSLTKSYIIKTKTNLKYKRLYKATPKAKKHILRSFSRAD